MLAGRPTHGYIDSSQIEALGGGKADVSNAPTAIPQTAALTTNGLIAGGGSTPDRWVRFRGEFPALQAFGNQFGRRSLALRRQRV
jgi:hypothetical protein